ncbi:hypothetical protein ACKVMT_06960 [Halobacteriales archaeon Cl-PHB]
MDHLVGEPDFRRPKHHDLQNRDLCKWCFRDGELTCDIDDLVVVVGGDSERLHRDESTGDVEISFEYRAPDQLATKLQDDDFGFEDLPAAGGDGGEA